MMKQCHQVGKSKQPDESIEMDEETKNRMINVYEYSRLNQARSIRQELNCSLLSILALLLLFSAVVYLAVFALKFIIESTKFYGDVQHCYLSEMHFNGWTFAYKCSKCTEGYVYEAAKLACVLEGKV